MTEFDDVLHEFLAETREGLDRYEHDVVDLERTSGDPGIISRMFRVVHTLKGNSGFLGLTGLESLAHSGEHLLGRIRDGGTAVGPEVAEGLLALADAIRDVLRGVERTGHDEPGAHAALTARLAALASATTARSAPASPGPGSVPSLPAAAAAEESVRVGVRLLDRLMNLADELVLVRNRVESFPAIRSDRELLESAQHLDLVTSELQAEVMQLRMQRLTVLWTRLPRLVRDMAAACGRQVSLHLSGEEIELDRAIVEAIRDPLIHLIRNAVDHGIEPPEVRAAAGKPADGSVHLRARYDGGRVRIEIEDDGAGIDLEAVRRSAVARGLLPEAEAAALGRRDVLNLVFLPGFTTSPTVSHVSGRGVGLDVVRVNVERIGGSVELRSIPGAGTTVLITLPLTLAILPALMVTAGGQVYAVPQVHVGEVIRLEDARDVEWVHEAAVCRHHDRLLPLVSLRTLLAGGGPATFREEAAGGGVRHIAVLDTGAARFGLAVDAIVDVHELVVRPRSRFMSGTPMFAGSTILGNGQVALILDVLEIARMANLAAAAEAPASRSARAAQAAPALPAERLLLFQSADGGRMVMPFDRVRRVALVPRSAVERSGVREVIQDRGSVLPLVQIADAVPDRRKQSRAVGTAGSGEDLHVVILGNGPHRIGLVVDRILDIVTESLSIDRPTGRPGVIGTAVVRGQATEVFDVEDALRRLDPGFLDTRPVVVPA